MFENIIGNEDKVNILKEALNSNNISHAYLFEGAKGVGKKTIAEEFAKSILKCDNLGSSPDYKYIKRFEDKKDILVDQIRKEIIDDIYIIPASGDKKIYIIDDAEFLNTASQNALLKTLEEPPKYAVIILIASNLNTFLPTILSRVYKISFNPVNEDKLQEYILNKYNIKLSQDVLKYLNGSIGLAKEIVENNLENKFKLIDELYVCIEQKDEITSLTKSSEIDFNDIKMLEYLEFLMFSNLKYNCVNIVEKAKQRLKYNGNYDIVIDSMILKIIQNM